MSAQVEKLVQALQWAVEWIDECSPMDLETIDAVRAIRELLGECLVGSMVTISENGMEGKVVRVYDDGDIYVIFDDGDEGSYEIGEVSA